MTAKWQGGLATLRLVSAAFLAMPVLFLLTLSMLWSLGPPEAGGWPARETGVGVVALGLLSLALVGWWRSRPLKTGTPEALAASYRTAFFVGLAMAEIPMLAGFAGAFLTGALWVYVAGMVPTVIGFLGIVPTGRNLARRQEQLAATGSPLSLETALQTAMPPMRPKPWESG